MPDSQIQLEGQLLLADPTLRDGIFDHSVVLLATHSADEGAFGLILNHPTGHTVGHFLKSKEFEPLRDIPVHIGGPVGNEQLTFSAFTWKLESGFHWDVRITAETAIQRSREPDTIVRAFVGYSGWSAGQLESELRRKSWFTTKPGPDLFGKVHDGTLWNAVLESLSHYHQVIARTPPHPEWN